MNLIVLTPEKELYRGQALSVNVPGSSGQFEVLNNHAPIVSSLDEGTIKIIQESGKELKFNIERGFIEVLNNDVSLLVRGVTQFAE